MRPLADFLASMTGRIFLVLAVGVALSAAVAWGLAETKRQADLRRLDVERAADRVEDVVARWQATPFEQRRMFDPGRSRGLRLAPPHAAGGETDAGLTERLRSRLPQLALQASDAPTALCRGAPDGPPPGAVQRECWLVTATQGAQVLRLLLESPPRPGGAPLVLDPLYMAVLIGAAAVLAFLVARMAAAPLLSLSDAAAELGGDLARRPLPVEGPTEVRQAATAFNAMQARLQRQLAERTHMLAAITHDLQTPVTRLRLRLEKVQEPELRERLLGDLAAMQLLIREGLELARTVDRTEARVVLDLRSLVESLVEDAADAGQAVTLTAAVDADVSGRPEALQRCLLNLIDNALKYGGSAEVSVGQEAGAPVVRVRDHGPGLPEDRLESVFDPFVRLEDSRSRESGGAGLGLTIARTLAERNGAVLTLRNHPEGGAEAVLRFGRT